MVRRNSGITFGRVAPVRLGQLVRIDFLLGALNPSSRLQPTHEPAQLGVDEPVQCRHRSAVGENRGVADHRRRSVVVSDNDLELTLRWTAEQRLDDVAFFRIHSIGADDAAAARGRR